MATAGQWLEGARPRTLFLAVAPVVAGTGVAAYDGGVDALRAVLALVVALALQVAVNYANDYSDGIRGTDAERVGPLRLVGSGSASPRAVAFAAAASFGVAVLAGLTLAVLVSLWLIVVGAVSIIAAWGYTGGPWPYGYHGLGEIFVLVFFGFVATGGTAYVQTTRITVTAVLVSLALGMLAVAVLVANNLRDIPGDTVSGKRTLAVVLGDRRTRGAYLGCLVIAFVVPLALVPRDGVAVLLPWLVLPLAWHAARPVRTGAVGPALIPCLKWTGLSALAYAVTIAVGLAVA